MGETYADIINDLVPYVAAWKPYLIMPYVYFLGWGILALVIVHFVNRWRA
jgi:hypothetical protein